MLVNSGCKNIKITINNLLFAAQKDRGKMSIFDKFKIDIPKPPSNNPPTPHGHDRNDMHGHGRNDMHGRGRDEYFAVIEQGGLFFSGELPDIKWSSVSLCRTYDELINKLTEKLNEVIKDAIKWDRPFPAKTSYNDLNNKYPGKKIIGIRPTIC